VRHGRGPAGRGPRRTDAAVTTSSATLTAIANRPLIPSTGTATTTPSTTNTTPKMIMMSSFLDTPRAWGQIDVSGTADHVFRWSPAAAL